MAVRIYRTALVHAYDAKVNGTGDTAADALARVPGVAIRVKRARVFMHLKSYAVDGRLLRAGAANFSASGLKRQDNDLVVLRDPAAAAAFAADFARMWKERDPVPAPPAGTP